MKLLSYRREELDVKLYRFVNYLQEEYNFMKKNWTFLESFLYCKLIFYFSDL